MPDLHFSFSKNKMKICAIFLLTNLQACGIMGRPRTGAGLRIPRVSSHYTIFLSNLSIGKLHKDFPETSSGCTRVVLVMTNEPITLCIYNYLPIFVHSVQKKLYSLYSFTIEIFRPLSYTIITPRDKPQGTYKGSD